MKKALGAFSYDLSVPPPAYRCADCGVFGPKLWRESYSSHVVLRCVMCAAAHVGRMMTCPASTTSCRMCLA
jgi:hypothetical protein